MKGVRMLVGNFELTLKGDKSGSGPTFLPLKENILNFDYLNSVNKQIATLKETFTAKHNHGVLSRTP